MVTYDASTESPDSHGRFTLTGCLSFEDALAAHRLATRGYRGWRLALAALVIVFCVVVTSMGIEAHSYAPEASTTIILFGGLFFPAVFMASFAWGRWRLRRAAKRHIGMFASAESIISPQRIDFSEENIKTEVQWPFFRGFRSNDRVAVLFLRESGGCLILSRAKMADADDWPRLVSLIASKLPPA